HPEQLRHLPYPIYRHLRDPTASRPRTSTAAGRLSLASTAVGQALMARGRRAGWGSRFLRFSAARQGLPEALLEPTTERREECGWDVAVGADGVRVKGVFLSARRRRSLRTRVERDATYRVVMMGVGSVWPLCR